MRKLYALLAGLCISLASIQSIAQQPTADKANFTFAVDAASNNVVFTNTTVTGELPGTRHAIWSFGDGTGQRTGMHDGTQHHYVTAGTYTVCLKIFRFIDNTNDSVLSAQECKTIVIESICSANFEYRDSVAPVDPLKHLVRFWAIPFNNSNKPVAEVCWNFGDGKDTCIKFSPNYPPTSALTIEHSYYQQGPYNVCVTIKYLDGCVSEKCKEVVLKNVPPDECGADFERLLPTVSNDVLYTTFRAITKHNHDKKPVRICWYFGDGKDTCIQYLNTNPGPYAVNHHYKEPGTYQVCLKILYDGGCESGTCRSIQIIRPDSCDADFEKIQVISSINSQRAYFKALPKHNNNKKPVTICWTFGDGKDTCIKYETGFTGTYAVPHNYKEPGTYEVCVKIQYDGGCESKKCKTIIINRPDACSADFEKVPLQTTNDPLRIYFKALPKHSNDKKPAVICWTFGDGKDTCIKYEPGFTGTYAVAHNYKEPGTYEVCVNIQYDGGCESKKCASIIIERPDACGADFERIQSIGNTSLAAYFRALTKHNNNKKPERICWKFGDGKDTCIKYEPGFTSQYVVGHYYQHAGVYEVCVDILYAGGCEAKQCRTIKIGEQDSCKADFETISVGSTPLRKYFTATPSHNNNKKPVYICWNFGDNTDTCIQYSVTQTAPYAVGHTYKNFGQYEVCVRIVYDGGCEAKQCKTITIGEPDACGADFERIQSTSNTSLAAYFRALTKHNNNKKPERICWKFGDGKDTCIKYEPGFTGQYVVGHYYQHAGTYEVCVNILYAGGCEAKQCKIIKIGEQDSCGADFETISVASTPLRKYFTATPSHNHNKKPVYICWNFGDNTDTCIQYSTTQTAPYAVGHNYKNFGQYEVCVRIVYDGGCESKKCKLINIPQIEHDTCVVKLLEVTPSITSLVRGFLASPSTNSGKKPESICWYFGDGKDTCVLINDQTTNALSPFFIRHAFPGLGVYKVCVKVIFQGGCIAYDCHEVTIRSFSNVCGGYMIDSLADPKTFVFKGFSIHNPNDEPAGFRWTFGDGSTAEGKEVKHSYATAGTYEVCLTIKTQSGCETKICKTVRVPANNEPALHLTPNPVITVVHVEFFSTHTEQVNIKVLNTSGIVVRNYVRNVTAGVNNWDVDLSSLLPGIYSFTVQSPNQLASIIFFKTN